ncbi:MAG TPA: hypothetical protein DD723_00115 [Candidatus Omnitrophica bacterium]|nr:MAG: hypothetical protein A2Z81_07215 [Omnitrophica WOR_2 bacterium GWA2_45_18]OGX21075.1 MAG: hypothetical protein A2Y04_04885 [Omnitrophica WOR_2 bacterium GWC2_45_7]HBR13939.1 hypothetical protein [Candidatus Omnitrophota bacterium]
MRARALKNDKKIIMVEGEYIRLVKKGEWEYVERNNCSGVVIVVAVTREGNVLFVEQYRPPVDRIVIEFPAGLVDDFESAKKETVITAAKRELFEETGYRAGRIIKLLEGPVSSGLSSDKVTMVKALDLEKVSEGGGVDNESITVHEIPLKSVGQWLKEMREKGYWVEPKIYAGLYFLQ